MAHHKGNLDLREQIHAALWDDHFIDDTISGVTKAECWLLTAQIWGKLESAGLVQRRRA